MTDWAEDGYPLCDLYGDCEPFEEQAHLVLADCQFCGGARYHVNGRWMTWTRSIDLYVADHGINGYTVGMIQDDRLPENYS